MMSSLIFLLLFSALAPSSTSSLKISDNEAKSNDLSLSPVVNNDMSLSPFTNYESSLSPVVNDELDPPLAERDESSLSFEWTGPRSLRVTSRFGDEDDIKLRTAPGIGDVTVNCLFTGFLMKDVGSSVGVLGCEDSSQSSITIVSNYSSGTMFTLFNQNKTTVELMEPSDDIDADYLEEELDRPKRSMHDDQYEEYYVEDDIEYSGVAMPPNLFYKFQLAYDDAILAIKQSKAATEKYLASVATLAQTYFKKASLGTNIHFIINPKMRYLEGKQFLIDPNIKDRGAKLTIEDAKAIENAEPLIIFTCTDELETWRGVASRRQACSQTDARALLKHRQLVQKAALDMAHELGHLFGSYDADSGKEHISCIGNGIMTGQGDPTKRPEQWSACTKARVLRVYNRIPKPTDPPSLKECLITAPTCDNTAWTGPCTCGIDGGDTTLCTSEEEGYCQPSTATCMVKETKLKSLTAKLETCSSFSVTPGGPLDSGCLQPEDLKDGVFACSRDGTFCHANCDRSFKLVTSSSVRFIECINERWIPLPTRFQCVPDCDNQRGKSHPDCQEDESPVYFIAGGDGAVRDISVYHPTVDNVACSISPPTLNNDWVYHTTFYHDNTIYMCGGRNTASTCISHNKDTEGWKTHTLTTARKFGHTSIVLQGRVYFVGGRDPSDNDVDAESTPLPLTDTPVLTPEHNLDYKGIYPCTARIDEDTLVVTGGYGGSSHLTTVATYNVKTRTYTQLPSLKQRRAYHGCVVLDKGNTKWIIVAGGHNGRHLQSTEMLQFGRREWTQIGNLNGAKKLHSMAVTQRGVMVMGGNDGSGYLSSVELLDWDSASKTWNVVQPSLNRPRGDFGGAVEIPASMFGCTG